VGGVSPLRNQIFSSLNRNSVAKSLGDRIGEASRRGKKGGGNYY